MSSAPPCSPLRRGARLYSTREGCLAVPCPFLAVGGVHHHFGHGDGEKIRQIKAGDFIAHPLCECHQLTNDGDGELRFCVIADNPASDVVKYPDSGNSSCSRRGWYFVTGTPGTIVSNAKNEHECRRTRKPVSRNEWQGNLPCKGLPMPRGLSVHLEDSGGFQDSPGHDLVGALGRWCSPLCV